jgi:diguanylate cyclase (GGDEF)-like protein
VGKAEESEVRPARSATPSYLGRNTTPLRFALGALALALTAALGTHALAHALTDALGVPLETSFVGVAFIGALGSLAAGWVHGKRVGKLAEEARRDPVTRVGNRRHWEECLAHEVASAAGAHMPLSLLMLDVDNLKKLNDAGGHGAGDLALAIVGDVLNETCRSRDVAARFGGDEFAVLLPRTRASEAMIVAERIRNELFRRRAVYSAPIGTMLTTSIGICDLASAASPEPQALFEGADRALYAAKQAGRDRIEVAARAATHPTSTVIVLDDRRRARKRSG